MKDINSLSSGAGVSWAFPSRQPVRGAKGVMAGLQLPGAGVIAQAGLCFCARLSAFASGPGPRQGSKCSAPAGSGSRQSSEPREETSLR